MYGWSEVYQQGPQVSSQSVKALPSYQGNSSMALGRNIGDPNSILSQLKGPKNDVTEPVYDPLKVHIRVRHPGIVHNEFV